MVEATRLTRRYDSIVAVDRATFSVPQGAIAGLLGPNGAGKSSTIRMLVGALQPTSGSISIAGIDAASRPLEARRQVGYLPEHNALHPELRVEEHLAYRGRLHGLRGRTLRLAVAEHLSRCGLDPVRRRLIGTLSKGFRQRVGVAAALMTGPAVVILDEPTSGLDPTQIDEFRSLVRSLSPARTVLLSSHILGEVDALCDRLIIMRSGRVVVEGTLREVRHRVGSGRRVIVEALAAPEDLRRILVQAVPDCSLRDAMGGGGGGGDRTQVAAAGRSSHRIEIDCGARDDGEIRRRIAEACAQTQIPLCELTTHEPPLEEVFRRLAATDGVETDGNRPGREEGPAASPAASSDAGPGATVADRSGHPSGGRR